MKIQLSKRKKKNMQNYAQIDDIDHYSLHNNTTYLSFQLLHNHRILYLHVIQRELIFDLSTLTHIKKIFLKNI